MFYPEFTQEYIKKIEQNPEAYLKDCERMLTRTKEDRRLYKQVVIPMTYQGMFFEKDQVALFEKIIAMMVSIGRKVLKQYVEDEDYRKSFRFSKTLEDLILHDPGYNIPVPVGRYDIFYNGGEDFKFCELNTDGSSAMNEDRVIGGILANSKIMEEMGEDWSIEQFELFHSLVHEFTQIYCKSHGTEPRTVAIVDFADLGTTKEFEHFQKVFNSEGYYTLICDPRDMWYENGKLHGKDVNTGEQAAIDLVYRRIVTSDFVERIEECPDFLQAYLDNAFMMLGSFQSQVMHAKLTFTVLHNEKTKEILNEEENNFIAKHVPQTKELLTEEDRKEILANKDGLILKPYNSYGSQGVYVGKEHDDGEWKEIVEKIPYEQYIYQEYVEVDPTPIVELVDGQFEVNPFGHVIGLFLYNEKFAGSYTRIGQKGIISGARDYYSAPVFVVDRK